MSDPPKFAGWSLLKWPVLSLLAALAWVTTTHAQLPVPPSSQFTIVGSLYNATVNSELDPLSAGTLMVNGQLIIVPRNTIVEMPAAALTWQQVFALAPAPYGIPGVTPGCTAAVPETGWSPGDTNGTPAPLHTYEVTVVGNRVINASGDQYIAALIYISQASLNSGQGYINWIDYANQELRVGGTLGSPTTGVRVRINDPIITTAGDPHLGRGRYSRGYATGLAVALGDQRFTCDQGNPTISSVTGYPMGIPVTANGLGDTLCPDINRPLAGDPNFANPNGIPNGAPLTSFTMPVVLTAPVPGAAVTSPTPWLEAPFKIGDYVDFIGTLVQDGDPTRGLTTGPMPPNGVAGTYISAHTIVNNAAIYTTGGTTPAYVRIEVTILGTGGNLVAGVAEATARTRFEGFTTDVGAVRGGGTPGKLVVGSTTGTDNIHVTAMDLDPITGAVTDRDWGTSDVDPGAPVGAAKGRWRLRPPGKVVTHPAAGAYVPPTRSVRAALSYGEIVEGTTPQPQPGRVLLPWVTTGNGLLSGQYNAPIFEYLFPEQILGSPIPPINPEVMPFLALGQGPLGSAITFPAVPAAANSTVVGQLSPWPGAVAPPAALLPPTAIVVNAAQTVQGGNNATGDATPSTGSPTLTFLWTQIGGPTTGVKINSPNSPSTLIGTPSVTVITTLTFQVRVSNSAGSSTANVTVTLNPPNTLFAVATATPSPVFETAASPTPLVTLDGTKSTGKTITSFAWTQVGPLVGGVVTPKVTINSANANKATFTAPALAVGSAPVTLTFQLKITGITFDGTTTTSTAIVNVVINPPSDTVTIVSVVYRSSQQRLTVSATSTAGAAATLTLKSFTVQGVTFGDSPMPLVNGIPTASIAGVGLPTTTQLFTVSSSAGGAASSPVTLFR